MASERYRVSVAPAEAGALIELRAGGDLFRTIEPALGAGTSALALGPGEWLLRTSQEREGPLASALEAAIGRAHGAVTVLSDAFVSFTVQGEDAAAVLAQGCPLDLQAAPECTRTLLARSSVIIVRHIAGYELLVERSHGAYASRWLARMSRGFR